MGVFFTSWQLWEEMTFVLAGAIVVVFFIGLVKLWQTSRQLRRQEQIDEEKRARRMDLRRVVPRGSKVNRGSGSNHHTARRKQRHGSDIPFGVRAIQSGVQVEGIWILRPAAPSRPNASPAVDQTQSQQQQETTTYIPVTAPAGDGGDLVLDTASPAVPTPLPQIAEDGTFPVVNTAHPGHGSSSGTNAFNEDALNHLEGAYWPTTATTPQNNTGLPHVDTYMPSSQRPGHRPGPTSSPVLRSHQGSSSSLCHSPQLAQAPVSVADRTSSSSNSNSQCSNPSAGKHCRTKSQDSCSNSSSRGTGVQQQQRPRVVNPGFEVLPAGTFGSAAVFCPPSAHGPPSDRKRDSLFAPPRNKLRRASERGSHINPEQK